MSFSPSTFFKHCLSLLKSKNGSSPFPSVMQLGRTGSLGYLCRLLAPPMLFSFGFQNCCKGCVNLNFLNMLCRIKVNTKTKTGLGHTHCRQVLVSHLVVHNCQQKLWLLWTVKSLIFLEVDLRCSLMKGSHNQTWTPQLVWCLADYQ